MYTGEVVSVSEQQLIDCDTAKPYEDAGCEGGDFTGPCICLCLCLMLPAGSGVPASPDVHLDSTAATEFYAGATSCRADAAEVFTWCWPFVQVACITSSRMAALTPRRTTPTLPRTRSATPRKRAGEHVDVAQGHSLADGLQSRFGKSQ